jgi:hypothetical protein
MPLDPDRVKEAGDKAQSLSKRMDALTERRKINDSAEDDDDDEDVDLDPTEETTLVDPAAEAMRLTPGVDLTPSDPPDDKEPWFK